MIIMSGKENISVKTKLINLKIVTKTFRDNYGTLFFYFYFCLGHFPNDLWS